MAATPEEKFTEWLEHLCLRPAMYMGVQNLKLMEAYLSGFGYGFRLGKDNLLFCIGGWHLLSYFMHPWVHGKYSVNHPAWGFSRILYHFHEHNEEAAIRAIPGLFQEYLQQGPLAYEAMREWCENRVRTEYNDEVGAPKCDKCCMHWGAP